MKEETVMKNLSFAFREGGGVDVQVQQLWRIVRDDGDEATSALLPHEAFTLAGATAAQKALLKKALGAAHAAQVAELHDTSLALTHREQEAHTAQLALAEAQGRLAEHEAALAALTQERDAALVTMAELREQLAQVQFDLELHRLPEQMFPPADAPPLDDPLP